MLTGTRLTGSRLTRKRQGVAILTAILTATSLTAGCAGEQLVEQIGEQAIDGEVDIEDDSITITDQEGNEFAAGSGTELPDSWPANVPTYPDAELVLVTSQADGAATGLWETTDAIETAAAKYDDALMAAGFVLDQDAEIAGTVIRTYEGDFQTVTVTITRTNGTTNASVTINPK